MLGLAFHEIIIKRNNQITELMKEGSVKVSIVSGMTLDKFVKVMSLKMAAVDEDDEIRQTFLIFDSQCT